MNRADKLVLFSLLAACASGPDPAAESSGAGGSGGQPSGSSSASSAASASSAGGGGGAEGGAGVGGGGGSLTEAEEPSWIAVDATHVYWTEPSSVRAVPKNGGDPVTLASAPSGSSYAAGGIVVDADAVYWTTHPNAYAGGPILRVALGGGTASTVAATNQDIPSGLVIDASRVFWGDELTDTSGKLTSALLTGGSETMLASGPEAAGFTFALDASDVYYATLPWFGMVARVPLDGGTPTVLASNEPCGTFTADESNLYWWTVEALPKLKSMPKSGGLPEVIASAEELPVGVHSMGLGHLVVDATHLYWTYPGTYVEVAGKVTTNNDGRVFKVPKTGGTPTVVAPARSPWGIAVDDDLVYWADYGSVSDGQYNGDGAILSAVK